jgi:elongation factor P
MATTSDIRKGMCIEFSNDTFTIIGFQHVKPGKGNAFVRTKLKSLTTGRVIENTFTAGHKVNDIRIERRVFQFLYQDDMGYNFMNNETFEQISLQEKMIENAKLLKEGTNVDILYHAAKEIPLTLEMPQYIILKVTYTEPGAKGNTATNAQKNATVETGAEIRVPLFINVDDLVKVDTSTGSYMERVKQ